jgi:hypothetical protein
MNIPKASNFKNDHSAEMELKFQKKNMVLLVYKLIKTISECYGLDTIVIEELVNIECGRKWSDTLIGSASALEYIANVNMDNGC